MNPLTRDEYLTLVWEKIDAYDCEAIDAIVDTAEAHNLDMETAGKIAARDSRLKALLESQARDRNCLKVVA